VHAWVAKYREGGKAVLKAQPVPGRPRKLGGAQLSRLHALQSAIYEGSKCAATFTGFGTRLLHGAPGAIYLIVDGHLAHRATAAKAFAAPAKGRYQLFFLPGHSPGRGGSRNAPG
jgi:hypothetical protein